MNTPKPFNPVVTEAMLAAAMQVYGNTNKGRIASALAHPDLHSQVRIYAAQVARQMVPDDECECEFDSNLEFGMAQGHNACRAATLSAIDEWEKNDG